jgi:hypothetical protein
MESDATPTDLIAANRALWEAWTELHVPSAFYDVEGFKQGRETLDAVELEGIMSAVGDIRGKSLLHLQCHFGLDTLSWARRGALRRQWGMPEGSRTRQESRPGLSAPT